MEIGLEAVCRNTETVLSFLSGKLPNGCIPTAIYCSIAGDRMFEEQLYPRMKPHVEAEHFRVADDGECIITGTLGRVDGGGMVCGTGASLYIRYGDTGRHIGGWGYLIDSGGSGYTMGRAALHAVMREADGRGEKTMLTELIGARMGVEPSRNIQAVYEGDAAISPLLPVRSSKEGSWGIRSASISSTARWRNWQSSLMWRPVITRGIFHCVKWRNFRQLSGAD